MRSKLATAVIVALGVISASTLAAETRINGFASFVAGSVIEEDEKLFGYDDTISFKPESLFALQIASDLGDGLSATAQIMSRGSNDYAAEFEWAYLSYEFNDSTQINAGKLRIPFYRYSDFLDVGYAYPWIRPSQTVYSLVFTTFNGLSLVNNHTIGDWESSIQGFYGNYDGSVDLLSDEDPATLNNMVGINWTLSNDWFNARAVYAQAETSISFENDIDPNQTLSTGISLISAVSTNAASSLTVEDDIGSFFGLGISVDYNSFLLDAEFTTVEVEDSIVATQEQYYVSIGYRLGDFTLYAMAEHAEDENDDNYSSDLPVSFPVSATQTEYPQATYQALLASQYEKIDGYTLGMRYNFHPSASLKVDYTNFDQTSFDLETSSLATAKRGLLTVGVNLVF